MATRETRKKRVAGWKASGLSAEDFALGRGFNADALREMGWQLLRLEPVQLARVEIVPERVPEVPVVLRISLWTSRTGAPISPTTSRGFLALGSFGLALAGVGLLLLWSGADIGVLLVGTGGVAFKDAWGWFASSEQERDEYLGRVEAARTLASARGFALPPAVPASRLIASGATLLTLAAGAAIFVLRKEQQVLAFVATLYLGGFAALCWLDVLRTWLRTRADRVQANN